MARGKGSVASNNDNISSYEEARTKRLEENKRRFEELGISGLAKSLSEVNKIMQKSPKPKVRMSSTKLDMMDVRRSTRSRSVALSYSQEFKTESSVSHPRKRSRRSIPLSNFGRPIEEIKFASNVERSYAMKRAMDFQHTLPSGCPSFIKSMLPSHVYRGFWLGLPADFCESHLGSDDMTMILEDMEGLKNDSIYKGEKRGLSGGWRSFALAHKIDDGDALVFEFIEPKTFKICIFKANERRIEKAVKKREEKITKDTHEKAAKK